MSWRISRKTIRGQQRYKLWSTISDSYITPKWLSKSAVMNYIFWQYLQDFMQTYMKTALQFPDGWTDKDTGERIIDEPQRLQYSKLLNEACRNPEAIPEAFLTKLQELQIDLKISDGIYMCSTEDK